MFAAIALLTSGVVAQRRRRGKHNGRGWDRRLLVLHGLAAALAIVAVAGEALAFQGPGQALALGVLGASALALGFLGVLRSAV